MKASSKQRNDQLLLRGEWLSGSITTERKRVFGWDSGLIGSQEKAKTSFSSYASFEEKKKKKKKKNGRKMRVR